MERSGCEKAHLIKSLNPNKVTFKICMFFVFEFYALNCGYSNAIYNIYIYNYSYTMDLDSHILSGLKKPGRKPKSRELPLR